MIRRLPNELDQMIIKHACANLATLERHKLRHTLTRVCKAWRDHINIDQDLVVVGRKNVKAAGARMMGDRLSRGKGAKVKTVYVKLQGRGSTSQAQSMGHLLGRVKEAEKVELVAGLSAMRGIAQEDASGLGEEVLVSLEKMNKLKHFQFGQTHGPLSNYPVIYSDDLSKSVTSTVRLRGQSMTILLI